MAEEVKRISISALCSQKGVAIEDPDINDSNFPPVEESMVGKPVLTRLIMDTETTQEVLKSMDKTKAAAGPADIFDLVSLVAPAPQEDHTSEGIKWIALGSSFDRKGKLCYPCLRYKEGKPVLSLACNTLWRDGHIFLAKTKAEV